MSSIKYTRKSFDNNKNTLLLGCHISISPSILSGLEYLTYIKGNAAQIFLGSTKSSSVNAKHKFTDINIINIKKYIKSNKIFVCVHSIYLLNFCKSDPYTNYGNVKYMHDNIQHDLKYGELIGAKCVVLHLGYKLLLESSIAIINFINNINKIIKDMSNNIALALETTAGQGTQIGYTLEDLALIWNGVKHNNKVTYLKNKAIDNKVHCLKVGICIDTAHVFASGYDISTIDGIKDYLNKFNKLIGWRNIIVFHINDSKFQCNSKKDFHQGIGHGELFNTSNGINALKYIKTFCIKRGIPMILETHKVSSQVILKGTNEINNTDNIVNIEKHINIEKNINIENIKKHNTGYKWEIQFIKNL